MRCVVFRTSVRLFVRVCLYLLLLRFRLYVCLCAVGCCYVCVVVDVVCLLLCVTILMVVAVKKEAGDKKRETRETKVKK